MTQYEPGLINNKYELVMPDFRVVFHRDRPDWEKGRLESCADLMKPGMVVYDIGAEHGDFTALYRKWVGDDGDVVPIEPSPHYWPFIKGTWQANGFTDPPYVSFCGLIGDIVESTAAGLHLGRWCDHADGKGIPDGGFVHLNQRPTTGMPLTTIDVLAVYAAPDVLVLDIEGAEFHALDGARYTLAEHRPIVYVSIHDVGDNAGWNGPLKDWYHKTPDDIHNLMKDFGYSHELLPSHGEGESFHLYIPQ